MTSAIAKTLSQMKSRAFAWVLARAVGLTLALFVATFFLLQWGFGFVPELPWAWANTAASFVAGLGLVVAFIFLLFPVAALFVGLFLEEVADAVEDRHYPNDPKGKSASFAAGLVTGLRFFLVVLGLNLLFLPLYFLLPGINILLFYSLNGYLIGREYFELVALRHHGATEMARMRRQERRTVFLAGLIIAIPLSIPLVNLIGPLFGVAFMVHVYKDIARRAG